jgi:glyoxylase-like metal-dependent hydrolase (beta-lactamase superfamily II)
MSSQLGVIIMTQVEIRAFFDEPTNTVTYLVWDKETGSGVVIDPVLDFDAASGEVDTKSVEHVLAAASAEQIRIEWVLETHVHADHLSGAPLVRAHTGARIGIGEHITDVQHIFRPIFNASDLKPDGGDFDALFADGASFQVGGMTVEVLYTPGHTPADVSYKIGDAVFVGDTLFMPDYGTARADFPGGDARQLYRSIHRLLALPPETRLYMCHDYKAPGRDHFAWETTVKAQIETNRHVHDGVTEDEFVTMRAERDAQLSAPKLLIPSIQVNMRGGRFPPATSSGVHFILVPVKIKASADKAALAVN